MRGLSVTWGDSDTPSRITRPSRLLRAALTAAVWLIGLVPLALGHARCTFVMLFHRPCPGCGMTRAMKLLFAGQTAESLAMNPFAVPVTLGALWLALATVKAAYTEGSPFFVYRTRFGKAAIVAAIALHVLVLAFWLMRGAGLFGGPVPV